MAEERIEIGGREFVRISRFGVVEDHPQDDGTGGSDAHYRHVQSSPSSEWTVAHNLGKRPAVAVVDTSGKRVFGGLVYESENTLRLVFSSPFSGEAFLN